MKLKSIITLAFCFLISYTGIAQINNISEELKAKIDSTYTSLLKKNKVTGASIAIVCMENTS